MSAFVVDTETMNRVVRALCSRTRYGQIVRSFAGIETDSHEAATLIGRRLFTLNIEAVMQRYPDCQEDPDNLPGTDGCAAYPRTFRAKPASRAPATRGDLVSGYKALRCLIYQCSEGDVPDSAELYRELTAAAGAVAGQVVAMLPEYDQAAWGG